MLIILCPLPAAGRLGAPWISSPGYYSPHVPDAPSASNTQPGQPDLQSELFEQSQAMHAPPLPARTVSPTAVVNNARVPIANTASTTYLLIILILSSVGTAARSKAHLFSGGHSGPVGWHRYGALPPTEALSKWIALMKLARPAPTSRPPHTFFTRPPGDVKIVSGVSRSLYAISAVA
jgi:hypothetical protein